MFCSVEFDFIDFAAKLVRLSAAAQTRLTLSQSHVHEPLVIDGQ